MLFLVFALQIIKFKYVFANQIIMRKKNFPRYYLSLRSIQCQYRGGFLFLMKCSSEALLSDKYIRIVYEKACYRWNFSIFKDKKKYFGYFFFFFYAIVYILKKKKNSITAVYYFYFECARSWAIRYESLAQKTFEISSLQDIIWESFANTTLKY